MLLAAAAAPQPAELKTFRDWTVGCDNGRVCQAVGLMPEDDPEAVTMSVRRGAGPGAAPEISINPPEGKAAALLIDGRSFALEEALDADAIAVLRPRDGAAFLNALLTARSAALADGRGKRLASLSPNGASAALLYMDDQQKRVGTVTALVRPGGRPASAVPRPPALPIVQRPPVPARVARTLGAAKARQLLGREATVCDYAKGLSMEGGRLDAQHSLVLVSHPCGNGAYNFSYSAFLVDERGGVRPARFDTNDDVLVNAGWDAKTGRLSAFSKGRGLGDCGTGQTWVWDGARFRLVHEEAMGECRGSVDYITTWRAEVK